MIEMKDELLAAPLNKLQHVPITVNHHKWWLQWCRFGDNGNFCFTFVSPQQREYVFSTELGRNGGKVTYAEVTLANGDTIASYCAIFGCKAESMDAVIRLTPKHVLDRLFLLLDAIE